MDEKTRKMGEQTTRQPPGQLRQPGESKASEWEERQTDPPDTNARLAATARAAATLLLRPARSQNQRLAAQENEHLLRQNLPGQQLPRQLSRRQLPGPRCEPLMTISEWEEAIEKQPSLLRLLRDRLLRERLRPNKSGRER